MSRNPDLLRCEFLGVTLRHDERAIDRAEPALLLARSGEAYGLNRLEYADDGATLSGPNGSELVIRAGQTATAGVTSLGFHEGLTRITGILEEVFGGEPPDALWIEDLTLIAVWDTEEPDGARLALTNDILQLDEERLALVSGDDPTASHGLRIWRKLDDGALDVALEPMHAEPSRLYLRLVYSQDDPVADLSAVCDRAESVNEYLRGALADFVQTRASR